MKNSFLLILLSSFLIIVTTLFITKNNSHKVANDISFTTACSPYDLSGAVDFSENNAFFEGKEFSIPELAYESNPSTAVLGLASEERWIEVDLSDQRLYAWEGDELFLESLVSTGLPSFNTPIGEFRI